MVEDMSDSGSSLESDINILWIRIPMKLLRDDEHWVYESQKEIGNPEQIVRGFIMRHPEIITHPKIMDTTQTPEPTIIGVELAFEIPEGRRVTYPDLILRINRTYYVVEVKYEMKSEPRAKNTVMRHYKALKYVLEKYKVPFDKIIPTVVSADKDIDGIRSRYHKSYGISIEESTSGRAIDYFPTLRSK